MIEQDKSRIQAFTGLAGSLYKGWVHSHGRYTAMAGTQPWQVHSHGRYTAMAGTQPWQVHDHSRRSAKKKEV